MFKLISAPQKQTDSDKSQMQRYLAQTPQEDAGTYARTVRVMGRPLEDQRCSPAHCMFAEGKPPQLNITFIEASSSLISSHFSTGCPFTGSSKLPWAYHACIGHLKLYIQVHAPHGSSMTSVDGPHLKSSEAPYKHQINTHLDKSVVFSDAAQASMEQQEQQDSTISDSSSSSSSPPLREIFSLKTSSSTETNSAAILDDEEAVSYNAMAEQVSGSDLVDEFARFTMSWLIDWAASRRNNVGLGIVKDKTTAEASERMGGNVSEKMTIGEETGPV